MLISFSFVHSVQPQKAICFSFLNNFMMRPLWRLHSMHKYQKQWHIFNFSWIARELFGYIHYAFWKWIGFRHTLLHRGCVWWVLIRKIEKLRSYVIPHGKCKSQLRRCVQLFAINPQLTFYWKTRRKWRKKTPDFVFFYWGTRGNLRENVWNASSDIGWAHWSDELFTVFLPQRKWRR